MAVSPKKTSKAKKNMRRSHHALTPAQYMKCPNCGALKLNHKICLECGYYKGKQIIGEVQE